MLLIFACFVQAQSGSSDQFETALRQCETFVVEYDDPASVHRGMQLYEKVIAQYPKEPMLGRAKMGLLRICSTAYTAESLAKATSLARGLLDEGKTDTEVGRELLLGYVEFQLNAAQGKAFQDLAAAERLMLSYETWAQAGEKKAELIKAWTLIGQIRIQGGAHSAAVQYLLGRSKEVQKWVPSFNKLWKEDKSKYEELVGLNTSLISTLGRAIDPCEDIPTIRAVANETVICSYEPIKNAVNSWKSKHPDVQLEAVPRVAPEPETQFAATLKDKIEPLHDVANDDNRTASVGISKDKSGGWVWVAIALSLAGLLAIIVTVHKKVAGTWYTKRANNEA
jgi:hypothetical protein